MSTFSQRIKNLRDLKGWNKSRTAQKLGVSVQRYSNWEYGLHEPDYEMLNQIASLFGTTTDYLTGKIDEPFKMQNAEGTSSDLDEMLDDIESYDGKPITNSDREAIRIFLQGRFSNK